ncbi:unnamed protein product [Cylicostephanus goldi]|uniref:BED-type domain-containing protein n=1 Tax=Cylicostephanus goldi TaxID=71465 RepID=A0A3P6QD81_CYLGO|nr:unnamed protein product [Cylicostephanus goldi]
MKTAKVWRFFDELPTPEQAAECRLCRKKIKATNSSTTGMIRHLRSCHVQEYQQVQEARQSTLILKMGRRISTFVSKNLLLPTFLVWFLLQTLRRLRIVDNLELILRGLLGLIG